MSSIGFDEPQPRQSGKPLHQFTRLLRWCGAALSVALAVAGCGGGGGATPAATAVTPTSAQSNQVAAYAQAQQSVTARVAPQVTSAQAVPSGTANMVVNGGFENGMAGWVDWGNSSVVAGQGSSGSSALGVGPDAGGAGQLIGGIVPGVSYRLAAQAKVAAAADTVYVGVNFLDSASHPLTQNAQLVTSTAYTTATLEVVAPPNAATAVVYVWKNAGSGLAYVDDFQFGPAASTAFVPTSGNMVANGGFENGFLGWDLWGNSRITNDQPGAGAASAQVGTGAGGFGQVVRGIVPGSAYRVSAYAKVGTPGDVAYLGVMFTDDSGNGLAVQNVEIRSWTYSITQADVTAPPNATKALVFVWKNDSAGYAFADEMSLTQVTASDSANPPPEVPVTSPVGTPMFQLPWDGAVTGQVVSSSNVLRHYSSEGLQVGPATTLNFPSGFGLATVLQGGGYAAAWMINVAPAGTDSMQLYTQAYDSAGQPIGSPRAIAFTSVTDHQNPAAVPQMAPLAGGGYVVVWAFEQSVAGGAADHAVYTQRFDANGQPAGPAWQATTDGSGFLDVIGTTTGGYVVTWGMTSGDVGGARAYGADGLPIAPAQVAGGSWHTGAGPRGSMAPTAGGGAAIVWQVANQPVYVQHITAAGAALPAQVASSLATPNRALVTNAGLPDGGSVAAWFELGGNVYARRFAADGTPLGPQTRINLSTTPAGGTEVMVLADGSFSISWLVGSNTRYARTFAANGLTAP